MKIKPRCVFCITHRFLRQTNPSYPILREAFALRKLAVAIITDAELIVTMERSRF